jgi:preprotein translocase subunit SecD
VVIVIVLYALVFFTGDRQPDPKLGIDLEGGTQIILTTRTPTGQLPSNDQLTLARQIIDQRVNGLGVTGAEVVQNGTNLTVTVPGDQGQRAKDLTQTAQLRFRPVLSGPYDTTQPPATGPGNAHTPSTRLGRPATAPGPESVRPRSIAALAPQTSSAHPHLPPTPPHHLMPALRASHGSTSLGAVTDPELARQITLARAERQGTQQTMQQKALQELQCNGNDVLRGYDDPTKPLVTCDQQRAAKYLLGPSFLDGTEIDTASAGYDAQHAGNVVTLTFKAPGAKIWGDYTTANVGKQAAFVLDAQVMSAPTIRGPIFGSTEISGTFSQSDATQLALVLKYGSLPLSFATSDAQTVSATLGLASLQAGLIAGGIGLALVFIYCLFYYRALGVLTILSLALSGLVVYAVLVLLGRSIGFTLDLAGAAGFIVAIGDHRRLLRNLLRATKGRSPGRPQLPRGGPPRLGTRTANHLVRGQCELPCLCGSLPARHRERAGIRVHARHVYRPGSRGGLSCHPSTGCPRRAVQAVQQLDLVRTGRGGPGRCATPTPSGRGHRGPAPVTASGRLARLLARTNWSRAEERR